MASPTYESLCLSSSLPIVPTVLDALRSVGTYQRGGLVLDISGNHPKNAAALHRRLGEADLLVILSFLKSSTTLSSAIVELRVCNNFSTDKVISELSTLILEEKLPKLASIDLSNSDVTPEACNSLISALLLQDVKATTSTSASPGTISRFQSLTLDGNPIGNLGGLAIANLVTNLSSLTSLRVARCELQTDAIIALASSLEKTNTLSFLDLSEPRLFSRNEETIYHIAKALRTNRSLKHLALRKHPYLSDSGITMLFDYLIDNSTNSQLNRSVKEKSDNSKGLISLDISNNHLGPPSGVIIAKAFLSGLDLQHLNLSRCRIGDEGAIALSKSLSSLGNRSTLVTLNLSYCGIGDEGEEAIAEYISKNDCTLSSIQLFGNENVAGARGTTALGIVLLSGAARCESDLKPYVVDEEMHLGYEKVGNES